MSENIPPISGPVLTPPPSMPPKKSKIWVWAVVLGVFAVLVCGVCGVGVFMIGAHSGVAVNGKELTRSELSNGKKEITAMTATVKTGDITSFDTSVVTTSPMSASFKHSIQKLKDAEAKMEKDSNEFDVETATKNMLLEKSKRDEARRKFDAFDKLCHEYISSEMKSVNNLVDLIQKVEPESVGMVSKVTDRLKTIEVGYQKTTQTRNSLLDFLDKTPHTSIGGQPVFEKDAEVQKFNKLLDDYVKASDDLVGIVKG